MNCKVTPDLSNIRKSEVVIIANNAKPVIPFLREKEEAISMASDALSGRKSIGEKIIVVGGGLVNCETAIWLAQQEKSVTIVEMLSDFDRGCQGVA